MFDERDILLPPLPLLRRYLHSHGWKSQRVREGALDLFSLALERSVVEIVLPSTSGDDVEHRIYQAIRTLAGISNRDIRLVAADVSMYDFDIFRSRLPTALVIRESIHLRVAEKFIANVRKLLVSAAAAELRRAPLVKDNLAVGSDYANSCRLGHTFRGSFGFTVESPAGPAAETLDGDPPPPPFERRVVERLARGLASAEEAAAVGSAEPLLAAAKEGFNVNMLADFSSLMADSGASSILFDFTLTPAWAPPESLKLSVQIAETIIPLAERAASVLRPEVEDVRETVIGKVIRLETKQNPADLYHEGAREIGLEGQSSQSGNVLLRVRLDPEPYLTAVDAHRSGQFVRVDGIIRRSSRGAVLSEPTGFQVLNS